MPAPLSKQVGLAADRVISKNPQLAGFAPIADRAGMDVRRFYRATEGAEQEISIYRDKRWSKAGGTAHVDLFCLVASYQAAMTGKSQSWRRPLKGVQLQHFQYALGGVGPSWPIASAMDVQTFESGLSEWLATVAIPWFAQFESDDGVIGYLLTRGLHARAARFLAGLGRMVEARAELGKYLSTLPRQADREFAALKKAGLLSEDEFRELSRASLQHIDRYQSFIDAWAKSHAGVSTSSSSATGRQRRD
jgi:hypothetical protein